MWEHNSDKICSAEVKCSSFDITSNAETLHLQLPVEWIFCIHAAVPSPLSLIVPWYDEPKFSLFKLDLFFFSIYLNMQRFKFKCIVLKIWGFDVNLLNRREGKALTKTMTPWNLSHGQWSKSWPWPWHPRICPWSMIKINQFWLPRKNF